MDSNGKMTSFCNAEDYRRWKNKWESIQQLCAVRQIWSISLDSGSWDQLTAALKSRLHLLRTGSKCTLKLHLRGLHFTHRAALFIALFWKIYVILALYSSFMHRIRCGVIM